jgi:hypothetical protein
MRICIDSCVFIRGIQQDDPAVVQLFNLLGPQLVLTIPRLVAREVSRNLIAPTQTRLFFSLFDDPEVALIVDELPPYPLITKYIGLGLPAKADAFIGAFAEWLKVDYLISDNRHFLRDLQADAFKVLSPTEFVSRWRTSV